MRALPLAVSLATGLCSLAPLPAQFGGDGRDGSFSPTSDTLLDTTGRPQGWSFTSIDIPLGVMVRIVGDQPALLRCVGAVHIGGDLCADGVVAVGDQPGSGGPGGFAGGAPGAPGDGPAGGSPGIGLLTFNSWGGNAGHATPGRGLQMVTTGIYGEALPFDLRGGSGGGGYASQLSGIRLGGEGGGGVIVLAADGAVLVTGRISADGAGTGTSRSGAGGSILLRSADQLRIVGEVSALGPNDGLPGPIRGQAGDGFVRLDSWAAAPVIEPVAVIVPEPALRTLPDLVTSDITRGQDWELRSRALPGDTVAFLYSGESGAVSVPSLGSYQLGPPDRTYVLAVLTVPSGHDAQAIHRLTIPDDPSLLGAPANAQALVPTTTAAAGPRLSNAVFDSIR